MSGGESEYDRKRDYRCQLLRPVGDADAWTDVVRSYVGEQYAEVG